MSKKYARFLSCLFCGFLGVIFIANALTPDKEFSEVENRALAQRPTLTLSDLAPQNLVEDKGDFYTGKFMADYETYTNDQFIFRDAWVAAKAYAEKLIGKKENNDVYFCDDSTLISRFDEPNWTRVDKNVTQIDKFIDKVDVPVAVGLIPTQAYVWADKLPEGAPNYDQREVWSKVADVLSGKATLVDGLWSTLSEHKDEAIFYRTDHHWTSLGAYYGYAAVMDSLGLGDQVVPLSDYTKTTVSTEFYGTVFSSSGVRWVKPDEMDTYVPEDGITVSSQTCDAQWNVLTDEPRPLYDKSYLEKKDKYSMFLGGNQPLAVVKTGNTDKPKLLIIRDSYTDSLVPFLTPHFSEIHLIDLRYCKAAASDYVTKAGIDQVLILYSVPNFSTDANFPFLR